MCLPEGMDELFEIVRFERTDAAYDIWLDEKKKLSDEDYRNPNIVARGYTDYVTVQDYPMRGRPVYLHMRKNNGGTRRPTRSSVTISNYPMRKGHDSAPSSWLF